MLPLAFLVFFDMFLGPFVSAIRALVVVEKFFNIDNYWASLTNVGYAVATFRLEARTFPAFLSFNVKKFLVLEFHVESSSASRAESEEFQFRSLIEC